MEWNLGRHFTQNSNKTADNPFDSTWGVAEGSSVSWVTKLQRDRVRMAAVEWAVADKSSEWQLSNGRSQIMQGDRLLFAARK